MARRGNRSGAAAWIRSAAGTGLVAWGCGILGAGLAHADEQLFAFARGAETVPKGHGELYQFATLRTGKKSGDYYAFDFETEAEYGFTDRLQASVSIVNHYFDVHDVEEQPDRTSYKFGGVEGSAKYRVLSPFQDPIGLALRVETGYLEHDDVGGFRQDEIVLHPELDLQKNFLDDTLIWDLDLGVEWAWGKQPAEQYPREVSLEASTGVAYRFASNWYLGAEVHERSEFPRFDLSNHEHTVVYAGPSLHYGTERWWATVSWLYQAYGRGVGETNQNVTFAEEQRQVVRLKFGWNF